MYNRALQGAYPPGSTFKMVTLTAAIENNVVEPDEVIYDHGVYMVPLARSRSVSGEWSSL